MANSLRQMRNLVYRMKRDYGVAMRFYYPTSENINLETGAIVKSYTVFDIAKVIALPSLEQYKENYEIGTRYIVIDKKDWLKDIDINDLNIRCRLDNKIYEFINVSNEYNSYEIKIRHIMGQPLVAITKNLTSILTFNQEITYEL